MARPGVQLKGQGFRGCLRALEALRGPEAVQASLAEVGGPAGEALRAGSIVPGGWYPFVWYGALYEGIQRACRTGPEYARVLSREATRTDINLVYRFVLRLLTPQTIVELTPRLWAMYIHGAEARASPKSAQSMALHISRLAGSTRATWEDLLGGIEVFVEASGARGVRVRPVRGGRDGDEELEVEVYWAA